MSLQHFLKLLRWLREVIFQDAAILYSRDPSCQFFRYPPFNSNLFRDFAATATSRITEIEEEARLRLHNLPENIILSVRGVLEGLELRRAAELDKARASQQELSRQLSVLTGAVEGSQASKKSRRQGHDG